MSCIGDRSTRQCSSFTTPRPSTSANPMHSSRIAPALLPLMALMTACGVRTSDDGAGVGSPLLIGMADGFSASSVLTGLNNPSGISFSGKGELTVCDSGNGQVILFVDGKPTNHITGFPTEYWKVNAEAGTKAFGLGPLSAVWLGDTLAVTTAGAKDGEETVHTAASAGEADALKEVIDGGADGSFRLPARAAATRRVHRRTVGGCPVARCAPLLSAASAIGDSGPTTLVYLRWLTLYLLPSARRARA